MDPVCNFEEPSRKLIDECAGIIIVGLVCLCIYNQMSFRKVIEKMTTCKQQHRERFNFILNKLLLFNFDCLVEVQVSSAMQIERIEGTQAVLGVCTEKPLVGMPLLCLPSNVQQSKLLHEYVNVLISSAEDDGFVFPVVGKKAYLSLRDESGVDVPVEFVAALIPSAATASKETSRLLVGFRRSPLYCNAVPSIPPSTSLKNAECHEPKATQQTAHDDSSMVNMVNAVDEHLPVSIDHDHKEQTTTFAATEVVNARQSSYSQEPRYIHPEWYSGDPHIAPEPHGQTQGLGVATSFGLSHDIPFGKKLSERSGKDETASFVSSQVGFVC